jgi:hypothetical protein
MINVFQLIYTIGRSIVVDHISSVGNGKDIGIAYLCCDYQDQANQSPQNLVASLVKQLSRRQGELSSILKDLYSRFTGGGKRPDLKELTSLLLQFSKSFNQTYILIDALDECNDASDRETFLAVLQEIQRASVKLFITSRSHLSDIPRVFGNQCRVDMTSNKKDIQEYLRTKLTGDFELAELIGPELREETVSNIVRKAGGM